MKKIQQKLREILGNAVKLPKHLACGNLPSRSSVHKVWSEAAGIIFSGQLATLIGNVVKADANSPFLNPYNLTIGGSGVLTGLITMTLTGIPATENIDAQKIVGVIQEGNNFQMQGCHLVYSFRGAGYNPQTQVLTLEFQVVDVITGAVIDLTSTDILFYLTVYLYD